MFAGSLIALCLFSRPCSASLEAVGTLLIETLVPRCRNALSTAAELQFLLYTNSQANCLPLQSLDQELDVTRKRLNDSLFQAGQCRRIHPLIAVCNAQKLQFGWEGRKPDKQRFRGGESNNK